MDCERVKRVVVIGATSGIGEFLSRCYAQAQAKVAILGRREDKLDELTAVDRNKFRFKIS